MEKRRKPTSGKITRTTHSARSRRTWSTAWRTPSTSKCVGFLPKFSALRVWHTGRQGSCVDHAELACFLTEKTRKLNRDRFDTLSIPQYVIKKGPLHGARHGNTERQRIDHAVHNAAKKADHTYVCTAKGHKRREHFCVLVLNSQCNNGPMKQREDHAKAIKNQRAIVRRIWRSKAKNPHQQTSVAKSDSTVLKIQCRSRTSWPENWMQVVSFYCLVKLVFVMVAIIRQLVAGMDLGWTLNFFFITIARCFTHKQWQFPM